jgi:glutamine amidotransferase
MSVVVVDSGSGNLRSVEKAVARAGAEVTVTRDPDLVARASKLVLPGQGAFGSSMAGLEREGGALKQAVLEAVRRGTPYLGLCIGMQILFDSSAEDPGVRGLGLVPGRVVRFAVPAPLRVPHMGWNACSPAAAAHRSPSLRALPAGSWFYFMHSYYAEPADPADVALVAEHGRRFCAAVARDNVTGVVFHPEKSQQAGLALLSAFVNG